MNCSRNSSSIPFSFSRENPISKYPPELTAQRDASTDTTAVHLRSIDGSFHFENLTSVTANVGLHFCWPTACVTPTRTIAPANNPDMHERFMSWYSFGFGF